MPSRTSDHRKWTISPLRHPVSRSCARGAQEAGSNDERRELGSPGVTALHIRDRHPLATEEFHPLWSVSFTELKTEIGNRA